MRLSVVILAVMALFLPSAGRGEETTKILLIGRDRDGHAYGTHMYLFECHLLARCLMQTPGVEAVVSNGWPTDPKILKDVRAIVLYTAQGGDVLFGSPIRSQVEEQLDRGVGLVAIHWGTGASPGGAGEAYLKYLGGWFHTSFAQIPVRRSRLRKADPDHPVCFGWEAFELREEFYINLKFLDEAKPVITANVDGKDYTVGWTYERPRSRGRSFGCICGHFHENFCIPELRRAFVNGILWAAHKDVPKDGAPVILAARELQLPPDKEAK